MPYSLVVLNGTVPGTARVLNPEEQVTIGRHPSRDIQLNDEKASRLHARVTRIADRWHVEDCESLNGTYVNSQPIKQVVLEPGDLIRIGDRVILFVDQARAMGPSQVNPEELRTEQIDSLGPPRPMPGGEPVPRLVRDSAVLCRLAHRLHEEADAESLIQTAIDTLVEGLDPDAVSCWTVGTDGRLRCAGRHGTPHEDHVLASLAVEEGRAVLLNPDDSKSLEQDVGVGRALSVPIPQRQSYLGAIECHRCPERDPFVRSDLDFVGVVSHQLGAALESVSHRESLEQANLELRRRLSEQSRMAGSSEAIQEVLDQVARVGPTRSNVLVLGESGTGKELIARSLHELSAQSAGPYITVNCAAFSESLLESELFGHEVGAFTGADRRYIGQFERAHRGTIFLDEVGEMSLACQAKLLRILEGHPFQRLGGQESLQVEVRVIAATHRDLEEWVREAKFREDLYYRLRVIDIHTPPLRERHDDVVELASLFLESFRRQLGRGPSRLSSAALRAMRDYPWPGNVRELKNAVERAVVLGRGDQVTPQDLGLTGSRGEHAHQPQLTSLREAERRHIEFVLKQVGGNKTRACKVLGIGRGTLYNKLEEYGAH